MNAAASKLTRAQVSQALIELNELCVGEYGMPLRQLLLDDSPLAAQRMQRLTGIVLKRKFATMSPRAASGFTGARRSWPWVAKPEAVANGGRELAILDQLREPGPWNEHKPVADPKDSDPTSWKDFKDDVEHERGLFKVLALWVSDRVNARQGKSVRDYLETKETRRFEAGLDLATLVFDAAVTGPVATLLGLPTLAVGVALVGIQYGYRKLTDNTEDRMGDGNA
jgi:hypothetical protein